MNQSLAISPRVKRILQTNQDARNSYNMLFICILADYGIYLTQEQRQILLHMPSVTSIDRAARKLWEQNAAPRPSKRVQRKRKEQEMEYRETFRYKWVFDNQGNATRV